MTPAVMKTRVTKGKEPEVIEAGEVIHGEPCAKLYVQILYLWSYCPVADKLHK